MKEVRDIQTALDDAQIVKETVEAVRKTICDDAATTTWFAVDALLTQVQVDLIMIELSKEFPTANFTFTRDLSVAPLSVASLSVVPPSISSDDDGWMLFTFEGRW